MTEELKKLDSRLESIAWAAFLIMAGTYLLFRWFLPDGMWGLGIGVVLLGLNVARYLNGLSMSTFTVVLGFLAFGSGLGSLLGVNLPMLPILLVIIGLYLVLRPRLEKDRKLFK